MVLRWVRSLAESVVCERLHAAAEACKTAEDAFAVVLQLPHEHHVVFEVRATTTMAVGRAPSSPRFPLPSSLDRVKPSWYQPCL